MNLSELQSWVSQALDQSVAPRTKRAHIREVRKFYEFRRMQRIEQQHPISQIAIYLSSFPYTRPSQRVFSQAVAGL